jgi:hypothetical protein
MNYDATRTPDAMRVLSAAMSSQASGQTQTVDLSAKTV